MLMHGEFRAYTLARDDNPFADLLASVVFEEGGKGRRGAVLVEPDEAGNTPVVRTTTRYAHPPQRFRPIHRQLARQIQDAAALPVAFNNALIESYTNAYATMGGHSDQALDLADGTCIAVFSCYRHPGQPARKLIVEDKQVGSAPFEIPLTHLGVVVFSLDTNRRHRHRIVLDQAARTPENQWLGVTFRTSRTLLRWLGGRAHLPDGTPLTLADEEQRREFYRLRGQENREPAFAYPPIAYTISESDLLRPEEDA